MITDDINKENVKITKNNNIISFRVKNNTENTLSAALVSPEELQSFSRAKMQPEKLTDKNEEKLVADTKTSAITYSEAFENASLEYEVSSWLSSGIIYQIFPDRFYRAEKNKNIPEYKVLHENYKKIII